MIRMQRLKTVECCWWCTKNLECGGDEPVCLAERPSIEECTDCDFYKEPSRCKDFEDKRDDILLVTGGDHVTCRFNKALE
jgi:hypothetical protein